MRSLLCQEAATSMHLSRIKCDINAPLPYPNVIPLRSLPYQEAAKERGGRRPGVRRRTRC